MRLGRCLSVLAEEQLVVKTNKSLGQHWLTDRQVLSQIADYAEITKNDTVLEIGPGLGTLTSELTRRAKKVIAVEFDAELARKLPSQFVGSSLEVIHKDILNFDTNELPNGYIVVANIPYNITSKLIQHLFESGNKPKIASLLVQKEVANRLASEPGKLSILAISAQIYSEINLGITVKAELFTPPPKIDSQVVILKLREKPLISEEIKKPFFRVVKAGFGEKRKKLRSSLSAGLNISKTNVEELLSGVGIDPNLRAESLSIDQWAKITKLLLDKGEIH